MVLLALSIGPYVFSLKSTDAQPSDDTCEKLPVAEVGANGVRGAASAQYAVDRDPDTRWANQAVGSFIQLDLGIKKALCAIDIAYNFVVSVSNDGTKKHCFYFKYRQDNIW
jgi:hypothetical protein